MTDLTTMTNAQLVGIYNGLNPDAPIKNWKGKKSVLIERINVLREAVEKAETQKAKSEARTIRSAAIELLCTTVFYEDRSKKPGPDNVVEAGAKGARSVGYPYGEIIHRIQVEFPGCKTTVACLRWYAVKIRVEEHGYENLALPQRRPRARPTTS